MSVCRKRVKRTPEAAQQLGPSGGESGNEWLERGDHPLLNDVVLKTLFGFVRRFDMKECRVACKKWNVNTIPHMRSTFRVTIHGSQSINKNRRIADFVKLFRKNILGIPLEKFNLTAFPTRDGVGHQFLQLCGEIAKDIDLNGAKSEIYKIEDVSKLLKSCPNLKRFGSPSSVTTHSGDIVKLFPDSAPTFSYLKKILFRLNCQHRLSFCPTFMEELMSAAPNIDVIVTGKLGQNEEVSTISVMLNGIEKMERQSSIQSLELRYAGIEYIQHLERMGQNGLKLMNLSFDPEETDDDLGRVQIQLATIFKDSLQYLKVKRIAENVLMEYPKMPNLKTLRLYGFLNSDPKPVNLNEYFPTLKTLDIGFEDWGMKWDEFFSQFFPCTNVESLDLVRGDIRIHTLRNIQTVFPNLNKLRFGVPEESEVILPQIWTQMTQLESLTFWGVVLGAEYLELDSLITGIPTKTLKRIRHVVNGLDKMTVQERKETILKLINDHSRLPSIRNLRSKDN